MTDTIEVDPDTRLMLDRLIIHYNTDGGHILRALLRERLRRIESIYTLEGPKN